MTIIKLYKATLSHKFEGNHPSLLVNSEYNLFQLLALQKLYKHIVRMAIRMYVIMSCAK